MSCALLILKIYTTFKDVQMMLKIFFDISTGFRFSKISVECSVHLWSCPCLYSTYTKLGPNLLAYFYSRVYNLKTKLTVFLLICKCLNALLSFLTYSISLPVPNRVNTKVRESSPYANFITAIFITVLFQNIPEIFDWCIFGPILSLLRFLCYQENIEKIAVMK